MCNYPLINYVTPSYLEHCLNSQYGIAISFNFPDVNFVVLCPSKKG